MGAYRPNDYDLLLFFISVCKKWNVPVILPPKNYEIDYLQDLFGSWYCRTEKTRTLKIPMYIKNNNDPVFALPLILRHRNCKRADREDKHICMLIYIRNKKQLIYYDPTENKDYDTSKLFGELIVKFSLLGHPVREVIISQAPGCPKGLQGAQEAPHFQMNKECVLGKTIGFCSIWSIHFLDRFFDHENKSCPKNLTKYITGYLDNLLKMRREFEHTLPPEIYKSFYLVKRRQLGESKLDIKSAYSNMLNYIVSKVLY